jgi:hypothetical protein
MKTSWIKRASVGVPLAILFALLLERFAPRRKQVEAAPSEADLASERLRAFETERHRATDFTKLAGWNESSGPDPYIVRFDPAHNRAVGILRGENALVVLDRSLREIQRLPVPASPTALAVADDGVAVAGELSPLVARFGWKDGTLVPDRVVDLGDVRAIRGLTIGPGGWLYVVEEHSGSLISIQVGERAKKKNAGARSEAHICTGPVSLERAGDRLIANCVLDHALVLQKLDPSGAVSSEPPIRIVHDGPMWSFAARPLPGGLLVAAGGVEDHPLDRTVGAFGYVDSFLYLYRVDFEKKTAFRLAMINLSELGVVTPKALALQASPGAEVTVAGYGSDLIAQLKFQEDLSAPPAISLHHLVPGASSVATLDDGSLAFADPLLDAWVLDSPEHDPRVVSVTGKNEASERDPLVRLGEALFFTTLMGPWNKSDGPLSRFTCETCHFEGYVDGRTHHTGRGDVHAVTKPLLGLFNNRPHFSRALDPDLVSVAFNEFRVAGAKSEHDPWFALSYADAPWLARIYPNQASFSPEVLRKALMVFLMTFNHRPNPMAFQRTTFSSDERAGAEVFRDRCESCHEARLVSDEPATRVPFDRWEQLVMSPAGPIVWGKAEYKKTGVVPYVHDLGARVPSLRRLYKKYPYFTNGSAKSIEEVLARARFVGPGDSGFLHEGPGDVLGDALDERARAALLRFLDIL